MLYILAQELPDPRLLTDGNTQQVMSWVILSLILLYGLTVTYFLKRQSSLETKYDKQNNKMMKLAVRSQRAIEVLANLPAPKIEEDLDEKED